MGGKTWDGGPSGLTRGAVDPPTWLWARGGARLSQSPPPLTQSGDVLALALSRGPLPGTPGTGGGEGVAVQEHPLPCL